MGWQHIDDELTTTGVGGGDGVAVLEVSRRAGRSIRRVQPLPLGEGVAGIVSHLTLPPGEWETTIVSDHLHER